MPTVRLRAPLSELAGGKRELELDGSTVGEVLQALGGVRWPTFNGVIGTEWKPTVAGLLLFGTRQALRRCFPTTRVEYIRVPGREWVPDPDRRFDTVELRDSLFWLMRRAEAAVLEDLPKACSGSARAICSAPTRPSSRSA